MNKGSNLQYVPWSGDTVSVQHLTGKRLFPGAELLAGIRDDHCIDSLHQKCTPRAIMDESQTMSAKTIAASDGYHR